MTSSHTWNIDQMSGLVMDFATKVLCRKMSILSSQRRKTKAQINYFIKITQLLNHNQRKQARQTGEPAFLIKTRKEI